MQTLEIRAVGVTGNDIGDAPMSLDLPDQMPFGQAGRQRHGRRGL